MRKMSTLFLVTHEGQNTTIYPAVRENLWVLEPGTRATIKFDGTATMVQEGILYKRYDAKHGRTAPEGAIPCQPEPDPVTGHHPHWVKCDRDNPADKYFFEAWDREEEVLPDCTYELCGEKVGRNAEKIKGHKLIKHGSEPALGFFWTFEGIKHYLANPENDIEGIVFHGVGGKKCKIRKSDFGFTR